MLYFNFNFYFTVVERYFSQVSARLAVLCLSNAEVVLLVSNQQRAKMLLSIQTIEGLKITGK